MGSDPGSLPDVDQKVCGGFSGFEKNPEVLAYNQFFKNISL